jgi:predicted nuclease of predicted toxin-antitoxin system
MNRADQAISIQQLTPLFTGDIRFRAGMACYQDENVALTLQSLLRSGQMRATSVYEQGQVGEQADTLILAKARELGCILITTDLGFIDIHERILSIPGLTHAGIILVTSQACKESPEQLAETLLRLNAKFEDFPDWLVNQVYTV